MDPVNILSDNGQGGLHMLKWEYCILSGVETSLNRRLSVSLTFSSRAHANQNLEIELDRDRSEEMFTTGYLGELGRDGWEVVAFHRASAKFEAVLKRPVEFDETPLSLAPEMN